MRGKTVLILVLCGGLVVACSGSQPKTDPSALTLEEYERNSKATEPPPPDPMANPDENSTDECSTECDSDADCCEGYYCGKDPEQSARKDYCLPAE